MFDRLHRSVKLDVERRTRLSGRQEGWKFEVEDGDGQFRSPARRRFDLQQLQITALVRFEREGRRIHVHGEDVDVDFTAVVALDAAGVCRFVVGEAMLTRSGRSGGWRSSNCSSRSRRRRSEPAAAASISRHFNPSASRPDNRPRLSVQADGIQITAISVIAPKLRDAEIENLDDPVPTHTFSSFRSKDPTLVSCRQALSYLHRMLDRPHRCEATGIEPAPQGLAFEPLGNNVGSALMRADVVDCRDVGMVQGSSGPGFLLKPLQAGGIRRGPGQ